MLKKLRVLIDIGHPAHVHLFRPFAHDMISRGHIILATCRPRGMIKELIDNTGLDYKVVGGYFKSIPGKIIGLARNDLSLYKEAKRFKPDILISHGSIYASHVAMILGKHHISLEDTFNLEQVRLYRPFTSVILTGDFPHPNLGKKEVMYSGYHELAYLHPGRFTPDPEVLKSLQLNESDRYVIIRFVSWSATHDLWQNGISMENKRKAVAEFSKYARVFISSESELPDDLEGYRLKVHPSAVHHIMAFSSLIFGESATMVTEGAVLGVPGIYVDRRNRYYTRDIEKNYGLIFNYTDSERDQLRAISRGLEILGNNTDSAWKLKSENLVRNKSDVTSFFVNFVEDFARSGGIL